MPIDPLRIGVVGCGNISGIYLENLSHFLPTTVLACADLDKSKAERAGAQYGVPKVCSVEELMGDSQIELVLNLTVPSAHYEVARAALDAGKHVYNEKPLSTAVGTAWKLLEVAREKGLKIGCAPDTFMGAGLQTCRKLLDDGAIGRPVAAQMSMTCHGHENWHPDPDFFYKPGAGPLMDMGPYYLTALVHLCGPIKQVGGIASVSFPERVVTSEPRRGQRIKVETPTHIVALLEFEEGAVADGTFSFDVWHSPLPPIVLHGTEGSMLVPDPNSFGGEVYVRGAKDTEWIPVPHTHGFASNSRGLGVMDMAYAIRTGRPHRASGDLAFHVLEAMICVLLSASKRGSFLRLTHGVERPEPLPQNLPENDLLG